MKKSVLLAALALAACKKDKLGGLEVTVRFGALSPAQCARVVVKGQVEQQSDALPRAARDLFVGVAQSDALGATVTLQALGYAAADCSGPSVDASASVERTFVPGVVGTGVLLTLEGTPPVNPDAGMDGGTKPDGGPTERCDNQVDDDGDQQTDCIDPDCDLQACGVGRVCTARLCVVATGEMNCSNGLDDDGNGPIDCLDDACANRACATSNLCTSSPRCINHACGGDPVMCGPPTECQTGTGTCQPQDGGCTYPVRTGACSDGGTCSNGSCTLELPFAPTNVPRNVPLGDVNGAYRFDCGNTVFDSSTGLWSNTCGQPMPRSFTVNQPGGAPILVVVALRGLDITTAGTLTIVGERPVAFEVFGDASIAGDLRANAAGADAGAGAPSTCVNGNGSAGTVATSAGGGGGGHGVRGANGGNDGAQNSTGGGGGAQSNNRGLSPLRGGCTGGLGGVPFAVIAAQGGGGGGAFQLTVAGTLTINGGHLSAAGGGGQGGVATRGGGAGGGSGGGILLEATLTHLSGGARLLALGGGGGGGAENTTVGGDGSDGHLSDTFSAAGGSRAGVRAGNGGNGDGPMDDADNGDDGDAFMNTVGGGGGGGGAMGLIVVHGACDMTGTVQTAPELANNSCDAI